MRELVLRSFRQFRTRRLESILICIAVALGVAVVTSVAAILALAQQAQADFEDELIAREVLLQPVEDDLDAFTTGGTDRLDVRVVGSIYSPSVELGFQDLEAARAAAPAVDYGYVRGFKTFSSDALGNDVLIASAVTPEYLPAARLEVMAGSLPSMSDFAEGRPVILLTPRFATLLGLEGNPVGQQVRFTGEDAPYTVVGLLPDIHEQLNVREAIVPYDPASGGRFRELRFAVDDAATLDEAVAQLQAFAQERWEGQVSVSSRRAASLRFLEQQQVRSLVIAVFACIAITVAALNIMGLMLARVLRRQRDIGINRSIGASRARVRNEVLAESLALGVSGGLLGLVGGYVLLRAYNAFLQTRVESFGVHVSYSLTAALIGLALALVLSLLFGLYPAVVASRVRIVDALRST